jgi:hypothetical protein
MFRNRPSSYRLPEPSTSVDPPVPDRREENRSAIENAEARHRACWYSRRTADFPTDIGFHTIEDGQLLFCAHPMWFPVVGYQFDIANCGGCDYYKAVRRTGVGR